jgi:hypothetical protein
MMWKIISGTLALETGSMLPQTENTGEESMQKAGSIFAVGQ